MADMARALELWSELAGLDPNAKSMTLGDLEVRSISKQIQEALDLDTDGLTAFLLMDYFANWYFNNRSFSVNEALKDYDGMLSYLAKAEGLKELLRHEDIVEAADRFEQAVINGLVRYKADREDVLKLARDRVELAFLRRDALRAVEGLHIYQFTHGEPDTAKPVFHEQIFVFWSVNDLLEMATNMPSGVALALIQDPDNYHSYFCFVMRNGGTISILTDRPQFGHPMQRQMMRRPDKAFLSRAFQYHFPYDLLGMKFDEEGNLFFRPGGGTGLVPYQENMRVASFIRDCKPNEVIWLSLVLDRIADKFYRKDFRTKELAYTGEMITDKGRLLSAAQRANLPVVNYQETRLERLKVEEVTVEAMADQVDMKSVGVNSWMEERYKDAVTEDALNLTMGPSNETLYITTHSAEIVKAKLSSLDKRSSDIPNTFGKLGYSRDDRRYDMQAVDLTAFGTEEEMRRDQMFIARTNKATLIQRAADLEYAQRKDEVLNWFKARVVANLPNLLRYIGEGKLEAANLKDVELALRDRPEDMNQFSRNMLSMIDLNSEERYVRRYVNGVTIGEIDAKRGWLCCINETKAIWLARFHPETAEGLALLAGCEMTDLPDVLQHWTSEDIRIGNNIIDRLDPMDWHLTNPWTRLQLEVGVYLGQRALKALKKDSAAA